MSLSDAASQPDSVELVPASRPRSRFRRWSNSADGRRLDASIEVLAAEIAARRADVPGPWFDVADRLLAQARALETDEAWSYYQAAVRHAAGGLAPAGVWAEQLIVLAEAREKLTSWRRDAVVGLLERAIDAPWDKEQAAAVAVVVAGGNRKAERAIAAALSAGGGPDGAAAEIERHLRDAGHRTPPETAAALVSLARRRVADDRAALQLAMLLRDEGARNVHRRNRLLRSNVVMLAAVAGLTAVALVLLAVTLPIEFGDRVEDAPPRLWAYGILLGALGGAVSALQRVTARGTRGRLPELRENALLAFVLPLAGAAAGTAAIPLAAAGVIPIDETVPTVLAVAFVAGFSERLIVRAAASLSGSGSGTPAA